MFCPALLGNKAFWLFLVSRAFSSLALMNFYNFMPAIVEENIPGADRYTASLVVSLSGVTNGVSRILSGFIKYCFKNFDQGMFTCWCFLLMGICSTIMTTCDNLGPMLLFASIFGVFQGPWHSQEIIVLLDIMDKSLQPSATGFFFSLYGLSVTIAPPIYGAIYEQTGTTHYGFFTSTSCFFLGALVGYVSVLVGKNESNRKLSG